MEHEGLIETDQRFARWYAEHHDRIRRQCERMLRDRAAAEDVTQETLLKAWERRDSVRDQDVGAWLSVVARNLCISHIRRGTRVVPLEPVHDRADHEADPALAAERNETRRNVLRALGGISRRHRRVLYLREVQGVDYQELGSELGMTSEGVRSIAFRARAVLREKLAAVGEGLSAIVFGVRIRLRSLSVRARSLSAPAEGAAWQAGINLALIVTISLSGVAANSDRPIGSEPTFASLAGPYSASARGGHHIVGPRSQVIATRPSESASSTSSPRVARVPTTTVDARPYDPDDGSGRYDVGVNGTGVTITFDRQENDYFGPVYRAEDRFFPQLCSQGVGVCRAN